MTDFSIEYHEENEVCWDDLIVYLKIIKNEIADWSFVWDTAIITTACWSIYWESIIWKDIEEILNLDYNYIVDLIWEEISNRRKNASVLALLTTRNAIHKYLHDWIIDNFEDVIN
jgi:nitrogen fixation protein NifU and related proteins